MQSLWNDSEAKQFKSDLDLRVYTSRLLGKETSLVLHGGGNTSVKIQEKNFFGEEEELLYVKGSGWDLATIEAPGFAPVKMETLLKMSDLPELSDMDMVKHQRAAMTNPSAPNPSVEAILHAIIPFKFVDHTHTDAVVALTNTPNGVEVMQSIFGESVLLIPYVMPGFILAKKIQEMSEGLDWSKIKGMVLLNHGVFSFSDSAKESYENMIELVSLAENFIKDNCEIQIDNQNVESINHLNLAQMRKKVSKMRGRPIFASIKQDKQSIYYSKLDNLKDLATRGPLTPDHVIRTKPEPALIQDDALEDLNQFEEDYQAYFNKHVKTETRLDTAPRWAVWKNKGAITFGASVKEMNICSDIIDHTLEAILRSEKLNAWQPISKADLFDMEYWSLEQAKLGKAPNLKPFDGKVVIVSGAASGIGLGCVNAYLNQGAAVIGLDISESVKNVTDSKQYLGLVCDVTDKKQLKTSIESGVETFGGIDVLVNNAGMFPPSMTIETMDTDLWDKSISLNLNSHKDLLQLCLPYLKEGIDPAVIFIASKNVPAPGPGASAYSVAKAGVNQLARVAALECAKDGIRINTIHPNAVFDTALWTDEILAKRAQSYGISVEEYKKNNLLKTEITSLDVGNLACSMSGNAFSKTTGAQVAIDGGNDRVI